MGSFKDKIIQSAVDGFIDGVEKSIKEQEQQKKNQQRQEEAKFWAENEQELIQAANAGDLDAIKILTVNYFKQTDYENAVYWGRKGAAVNDDTCLFILGEIAVNQENFAVAEKFFMRNINVNADANSASELGFLYLNPADNPNFPKDIERAATLFNFALQQNSTHPDASYGLAIYLMNQENYDIEKFKQLLQQATRSENASVKNDAQQALQNIQEEERRAASNNYNKNNNSGGGCFITTAVCQNFGKADDCCELTAFRNFRDGWLMNQSDGKNLIAEYYDTAPKIVAKIDSLANAAEIYKSIWEKYLKPCLKFIEGGDNLSCKNKYIEMVENLKKKFF